MGDGRDIAPAIKWGKGQQQLRYSGKCGTLHIFAEQTDANIARQES